MRALLAALLAAVLVAPAGDPALGRRLYQEGTLASGAPVEVELATGGVLSGKAAACSSCHRPSGFGGVEGGLYLPPVTGPYLFGGRVNRRIDLFHELFQEELASEVWARLRQRPDRPAYTASSFRAALATGHDPTGRAFDPRMPRYALGAADAANLQAYLEGLGAASDPGVDAESIRFVTVVDGPADTPAERARLAVLEAFFRLKNADTGRLKQRPPDPFGHEEHFPPAYRHWQLEVVTLDLEAPDWPRTLAVELRARPPFALLAGPGGEKGSKLAALCEQQSLPCLLLEEGPGEEGPRSAVVRRVDASSCPPGAVEPPQAFRARQWLRARGIPAGPGESTALATYHLLSVTEPALMQLVDDFSRAYFLETFDREAGRVPSPLACQSR